MIVGIGDWRPQKGGAHGKFRVADDRDTDFARIVKTGGKELSLELEEKGYDWVHEEPLAAAA